MLLYNVSLTCNCFSSMLWIRLNTMIHCTGMLAFLRSLTIEHRTIGMKHNKRITLCNYACILIYSIHKPAPHKTAYFTADALTPIIFLAKNYCLIKRRATKSSSSSPHTRSSKSVYRILILNSSRLRQFGVRRNATPAFCRNKKQADMRELTETIKFWLMCPYVLRTYVIR